MNDRKDRPRVLQSFSSSQAPEAALHANSVDEMEQMIHSNADGKASQAAEKLKTAERVRELPVALLPKSGFLGAAISYWQTYNETSDTFLLASALTALSVAGGPGTYLVDGDTPLWLNLWSVIIGPSTSGRKSTALKLPKTLGYQAGLDPFSFPRCTAEGLIGVAATKKGLKKDDPDIPGQTFGLWTEDEFSELNSLLEKEYNSNLKSGLLQAFDGGLVDVYTKTLGRQLAKFEGLSILSATVPDRLGFNSGDHTSGWMGRWLIWPCSTGSGRCFPIRPQPNRDFQNQLCVFLTEIRLGREMFFQDEALENYSNWYTSEQTKQVPEALASNWERHKVYVKKLAALKALSERLYQVRSEDVFWAIAFVEWQRENLRLIIRDEQTTSFGKLQKRFIDYLIKNKGTATRKQVCQSLSVRIAELEDVIEALKEAGRITETTRQNTGSKSSLVYLLIDEPD